MGWARCGQNSKTGDWMGYAYKGTCAHPGCKKRIDHGLSYVCGGMHEGGDHGCGKYFCDFHLYIMKLNGQVTRLCESCCETQGPKCESCGDERTDLVHTPMIDVCPDCIEHAYRSTGVPVEPNKKETPSD